MKRYVAAAGFVALAWYFQRDHRADPQVAVTHVIRPYSAAQVSAVREPSAEPQTTKKTTIVEAPVTLVSKDFSKSKIEPADTEWVEQKGLPGDLKLAVDVFSISADRFSPNMGVVVASNDKTVTYRSSERAYGSQYVAVDPANGRYYPIAPTVKLTNVTESVRQELLSQGYSEHYYNEELKVMFVEGPGADVLTTLSALSEQNINGGLEVIRGFNRVR